MRKRITLALIWIFASSCAAPQSSAPQMENSPQPYFTVARPPTATPNLLPAATLLPTALSVSQIVCRPTANSALWCFALIQNDGDDTLEDVSARINLLDESGTIRASQTAFTLLDGIPPKSALPLYAFFSNVPADLEPQIQLLSATQKNATDAPTAILDATLAQIDRNGKRAQVSGRVYLPAESNAATQIWIAATAYDDDGAIVGARRWQGGALQPGGTLDFQFDVFSVGGEIAALEFVVEAKR